MATPAIRNLIRDDKIHQIYGTMQTGQEKLGMQTMNQSLARLVEKRLITRDVGARHLVASRRIDHDPRTRRGRAASAAAPGGSRRRADGTGGRR